MSDEGQAFDLIYTGPDLLRLDRTFSQEGIVGLMARIARFVGTEVRRRWKETGAGPKWMRVSVKVDFMSGPTKVPVTQIVDGQHRTYAVKRPKR